LLLRIVVTSCDCNLDLYYDLSMLLNRRKVIRPTAVGVPIGIFSRRESIFGKRAWKCDTDEFRRDAKSYIMMVSLFTANIVR
jgi:hypothetical protein